MIASIKRDVNSASSPLTSAGAGQWVVVDSLAGAHGSAGRLADLGLLVGSHARMIRPSRGGPVLIEVKGSRLALGHALARKIHVRMVDRDPREVAEAAGG